LIAVVTLLVLWRKTIAREQAIRGFLPGVGALDDAIVAGLVLRHVVKRAGPEIAKDHRRGDPKTIGLLLRAAPVS
jgi:hypothetical protein